MLSRYTCIGYFHSLYWQLEVFCVQKKNCLLFGIAFFTILNFASAQDIPKRMEKYVLTPMSFDASKYTLKEKELLQTLIEAGKLVDEIYWRQSYAGNIALREEITKSQSADDPVRKFFFMQTGPFDRLDNNAPFMKVPPKP